MLAEHWALNTHGFCRILLVVVESSFFYSQYDMSTFHIDGFPTPNLSRRPNYADVTSGKRIWFANTGIESKINLNNNLIKKRRKIASTSEKQNLNKADLVYPPYSNKIVISIQAD